MNKLRTSNREACRPDFPQFACCADAAGHRAIGLDLSGMTVLTEAASAYGVTAVIAAMADQARARVHAGEPLRLCLGSDSMDVAIG